MIIYTIYDYPKKNSENIYFHEGMNEKHSFLRDTCMLPGGSGKRVRLTEDMLPFQSSYQTEVSMEWK